MKWSGQHVVVVASGPSLTKADCETVELSGALTLGVNSVWKWIPWIDALYAGDYRYWKSYSEDIVQSGFVGKRYSRSSRAEKTYGAKYVKSRLGQDYNSGQMAIETAIRFGSEKVILLGFDCSLDKGSHFHGDHDKTPNPNPHRIERWKEQFSRIPKHYKAADVVNCSAETALTCFPCSDLREHIASIPESSIRRARALQGVH